MVRKRDLEDDIPLYFEPRTKAQTAAIEVMMNNTVTFLTGPAGTGKTQCAVYSAVKEMKEVNNGRRKQINNIIVTRPIIEAGEHLGHLPGEVNEKVHPYMRPILDCVSKIIHSPRFIDENIEIAPLAYQRGRTFEHCVAILDEAQNCTRSQLILFLTRLGIGGRMVITGDTDQSDIGDKSGLIGVINDLRGEEGIGFFEFEDTDIVRNELVTRMLRRLMKKPNDTAKSNGIKRHN